MVIINNGYKGQVMEIYNDNINDNYTLYNELISYSPKKIKLICINEKNIIIKNTDKSYNDILNILKNIKDTLVKKFIYVNFLYGSIKHNYNNELTGYKNLIKIFKNDITKHTTIKYGFKFNDKKIYGIVFDDYHYLFLEKCFENLDEITFTQETLDKCTKNIFETLNILNKNDIIHNDLKPNNIILCKNRFKIIDWESSNFIKNQHNNIFNTKNGNIIFNHPIKFYMLGVPFFIYLYIFKYYIDNKNQYLKKSKYAKIIIKKLKSSFNLVLDKYNSIKNKKIKFSNSYKYKSFKDIDEDKYYFLKLFDYYSFALSIIFIAEKHKLNYNKTIINPILSKFFIDI